MSGGFNSDIFYIALDLHISFYLKYDKIEISIVYFIHICSPQSANILLIIL